MFCTIKNHITKENAFFFLLLAFTSSLPLHYIISNYLMVLLVIGFLLRGNFNREIFSLQKSKFLYLFIGYFILLIVGLFYTTNIKQGFSLVERSIPILALPLVVFASKKLTEFQLRTLLRVFTYSCFVISLVCLSVASFRMIDNKSGFNPSYFSNFELTESVGLHPIYFAIHVSFCIYIILFYFLQRGFIPKYLAILMIGYFMIFVTLLGAKMVISINVCVLIFYTLLVSSKYRKVYLITVVITLLISVASILSFDVTRERFRSTFFLEKKGSVITYGSFFLRLELWKSSSKIIARNALIGVGTGGEHDALMKQYSIDDFNYAIENNWNAHNQYLSTAISLGFLGLMWLCMMFALPLVYAIRKKRYLYVAFLILMIGSCLTESMFNLNKGIVFYSFINALLFSHGSLLE